MQGAKIIPMEIKKAAGTYRASRDKHSPAPSEEIATPPDWLCDRAKEIFNMLVEKRLKPLGAASSTYTEAITDMAVALYDIEKCTKIIQENGYMENYMSSQGYPATRVRPEVQIKKDARNFLKSMYAEFGLTKVSGNKLPALPVGNEEDDFKDF